MTEQKDRVKVIASCGFTINLGNFESARIDAGVEIQGNKEDMPKLWKEAEDEISKQLASQIQLLQEELGRSTTTILGRPKAPVITSKL